MGAERSVMVFRDDPLPSQIVLEYDLTSSKRYAYRDRDEPTASVCSSLEHGSIQKRRYVVLYCLAHFETVRLVACGVGATQCTLYATPQATALAVG